MDETEPGLERASQIIIISASVPHPSCRTHLQARSYHTFFTTRVSYVFLTNVKVRLAGRDSSVNVLGSEQFRLGIIPGTLPIQH